MCVTLRWIGPYIFCHRDGNPSSTIRNLFTVKESVYSVPSSVLRFMSRYGPSFDLTVRPFDSVFKFHPTVPVPRRYLPV